MMFSTEKLSMATLVAVNVGLPRDVSWNDEVVHTGIWKQSVVGPQMVRRLNIAARDAPVLLGMLRQILWKVGG